MTLIKIIFFQKEKKITNIKKAKIIDNKSIVNE